LKWLLIRRGDDHLGREERERLTEAGRAPGRNRTGATAGGGGGDLDGGGD